MRYHEIITEAQTPKANWVMPSDSDLLLEFKYEYENRDWERRCDRIDAMYPLFEDGQDFIQKVKAGQVRSFSESDRVENTTYFDLDTLREVVAGYAYPRDVDRIIAGFAAGTPMPMPIIIEGSDGSWILSGNTRSNIAYTMGLPCKAIWINAEY